MLSCLLLLQVPDLGHNFCTQADGDNISFRSTIFGCLKVSFFSYLVKFSVYDNFTIRVGSEGNPSCIVKLEICLA